MSFGFFSRIGEVLKYADEVIGTVTAVASYLVHKDEGQLADEVTVQLLSAVKDAFGGDPSGKVDEERVRKGVVEIVKALEPLF